MSESLAAAVFVHGAGGGGWEWRVWARVFAAAGVAVSAPDLRAVAAGLAATTLDDYAGQVRGWIAAMRADGCPVAVVGASLGGLLAARAADLADALVLVNPLPPAGLPGATGGGPIRPWGRRASLAGTRHALPDADDFTTHDAWRRWRDESGAVLAAAHAGVAVARPACPVLVIASTGDADVPATVSGRLAADWGADLLRVEGSHVGPTIGSIRKGRAATAQESRREGDQECEEAADYPSVREQTQAKRQDLG